MVHSREPKPMCFPSEARRTAAGSTLGLLTDREGRTDLQAGRVYHMVYDSFVLVMSVWLRLSSRTMRECQSTLKLWFAGSSFAGVRFSQFR